MNRLVTLFALLALVCCAIAQDNYVSIEFYEEDDCSGSIQSSGYYELDVCFYDGESLVYPYRNIECTGSTVTSNMCTDSSCTNCVVDSESYTTGECDGNYQKIIIELFHFIIVRFFSSAFKIFASPFFTNILDWRLPASNDGGSVFAVCSATVPDVFTGYSGIVLKQEAYPNSNCNGDPYLVSFGSAGTDECDGGNNTKRCV